MPEAPQWARVRGDVNCNVRRGAWYEVVRVSPEDVVLDVNQRTVSIARTSVRSCRSGRSAGRSWHARKTPSIFH